MTREFANLKYDQLIGLHAHTNGLPEASQPVAGPGLECNLEAFFRATVEEDVGTLYGGNHACHGNVRTVES